jgi:hypothetical protein
MRMKLMVVDALPIKTTNAKNKNRCVVVAKKLPAKRSRKTNVNKM